MQITALASRIWRQNIGIATTFWAGCLVLVAIEATMGASLFVGALFFVSLPALVGLLTWVNRDIVFRRTPREPASVLLLGVAVLLASSLIVFVGLLAAANLKALIASG
jgi:hypothetical protein